MTVTSVRPAAAVCNVTPPVVRCWLSVGLLTAPPWTLQQLHQVRKLADPDGRGRGPQVGTRHPHPVAGGLRLRSLPGSAERRSQGPGSPVVHLHTSIRTRDARTFAASGQP